MTTTTFTCVVHLHFTICTFGNCMKQGVPRANNCEGKNKWKTIMWFQKEHPNVQNVPHRDGSGISPTKRVSKRLLLPIIV